jgi:hypothetical protein
VFASRSGREPTPRRRSRSRSSTSRWRATARRPRRRSRAGWSSARGGAWTSRPSTSSRCGRGCGGHGARRHRPLRHGARALGGARARPVPARTRSASRARRHHAWFAGMAGPSGASPRSSSPSSWSTPAAARRRRRPSWPRPPTSICAGSTAWPVDSVQTYLEHLLSRAAGALVRAPLRPAGDGVRAQVRASMTPGGELIP